MSSGSGGQFDFSNFGGASAPPSTTPSGAPASTPGAAPAATPAEQGDAGFGFAQDSSAADTSPGLTLSTPPVVWLYIGIGLAVLAGLASAIDGSVPAVAIAAWVVAGPVAISVFAIFTLKDTAARAGALYASPGWVVWLYRVGLVLAFIAIIVSALAIAQWVGRL